MGAETTRHIVTLLHCGDLGRLGVPAIRARAVRQALGGRGETSRHVVELKGASSRTDCTRSLGVQSKNMICACMAMQTSSLQFLLSVLQKGLQL